MTISRYVLNASTTFVAKLPNALVAIFMSIIATCFIALDFDKIKGFIVRQFRDNHLDTMVQVKDVFSQSVIRYIKSYAIILLITFTEAAIGLTIIGVDYAILISFFIAIVDILPVLGTGTVVIPWIVVCFVTGDVYRGVGLLILYIIITVVRQIIEPKIVSQNVALHPLVTLMAMYVGAKLLGIIGLFGFPITIIILQSLNESGRIHLWKTVDRDLGAPNRTKNWKKKFFIRDNGTKGDPDEEKGNEKK